MKMKARGWLKYNGQWYAKGETFEADPKDLAEIAERAETVNAPTLEASGEERPAKKTSRRKKEQ